VESGLGCWELLTVDQSRCVGFRAVDD
jgi:hypothetical protein